MADSKVSALTAATAATTDDLLYLVDDPGGTAASKKITVANFLTKLASAPTPATNDGVALGVAGTAFSDLFLASGGVVNFSNGDVTLTHSTGTLTMASAYVSGTGLFLDNTDTGGKEWRIISGASLNGEGAGSLIFNNTDDNQTYLYMKAGVHHFENGANTVFEIQSTDTAPSPADTIGAIKFYSYDDAGTPASVQMSEIHSRVFDNTSGSEYGTLDLSVMGNGSMKELVTGVDFSLTALGSSGVGFLLGVSGEDFRFLGWNTTDETNADDLYFLSAAGGEAGAGQGYNAGNLYLGANDGSDAGGGDTNGGDGGSVYLYAGAGGALSGGGADGSDGNVHLAYTGSAQQGVVKIGHATAANSAKLSLGADVDGKKLGIFDNGTAGDFWGIGLRAGLMDIWADGGIAQTFNAINRKVDFSSGFTASGTDDYGVYFSSTLNNGSAGGSDTFSLIKGNITETDASGWNYKYLMNLGVGGTTKYRITDDGFVGILTSADPISELQVKGVVTIGEGDDAKYLRLTSYSSGDRYGYIAAQQEDGSLGTTGLKLQTANGGAGVIAITLSASGTVTAPLVYTTTTATAANVNVASGGLLARSTSSIKIKENVEYDKVGELAEYARKLKPVTFDSKPDKLPMIGFIAEDCRDIDSRLANQDKELPGLELPAIVASLTALVQKQQEEIEYLKTKI